MTKPINAEISRSRHELRGYSTQQDYYTENVWRPCAHTRREIYERQAAEAQKQAKADKQKNQMMDESRPKCTII